MGPARATESAGIRALTFSAQLFLAGFLIDNSKKAKSLDGDVAIGIRMNQRFSLRHQNPVLALLMRRQTGARRRGQAQRAEIVERARSRHAGHAVEEPPRHAPGNLADVEALQNAEDILGPGRRSFGGGFRAGVHFHVRSAGRHCPARDNRGRRILRKGKNGISVFAKEYGSMNANAGELAAAFDLEKLTPEFYTDPYPTYRALREHEPVKLLPNGAYFLTRYDHLVTAYKTTKTFSHDNKKEFYPKNGSSQLDAHHSTSLVFTHPPTHTRVRSQVMGALPPRALAGRHPDHPEPGAEMPAGHRHGRDPDPAAEAPGGPRRQRHGGPARGDAGSAGAVGAGRHDR